MCFLLFAFLPFCTHSGSSFKISVILSCSFWSCFFYSYSASVDLSRHSSFFFWDYAAILHARWPHVPICSTAIFHARLDLFSLGSTTIFRVRFDPSSLDSTTIFRVRFESVSLGFPTSFHVRDSLVLFCPALGSRTSKYAESMLKRFWASTCNY